MIRKLILFTTIFILAMSSLNLQFVDAKSSNEIKTVIDYFSKINSKDWAAVSKYWDEENKKTFDEFLEDKSNYKNREGVFNLKEISLLKWKKINNDVGYIQVFSNDSDIFYIAAECKVFNESKYFMNGVNYFIVEIVNENGVSKIKQLSIAPVEIINSMGVGFKDSDEEKAAKNFKKRYEGIYQDQNGEVIEINKNKNEKKKTKQEVIDILGISNSDINSPDITTLATHTTPDWVRVRITSTYNKPKYNCTSDCTVSVAFNPYLRSVLPNEWKIYQANMNSLMTGALTVKMFTWYRTIHPLLPSVNADLYDDNRSQVYKKDSETTNTNTAFSNVEGIGFHQKSNQVIFEAQYLKGSYSSGGKAGGYVWQDGTDYWAEKQGYQPYQILSHYYNDSSKVGGAGGEYEFFTY